MSHNIDNYLKGRDATDVFDFQYVSIKLTSGENIFASLADVDDEMYCVMVPLKVATVQQGDSYVSALVEYTVGSDDIFSLLPKRHCMLITLLSESSIIEYKKALQKVMASITQLTEDEPNEDNVVAFSPKILH